MVHDLQNSKLRLRWKPKMADISRLAFSPTAPLLAATSSDGSAIILDVKTRQLVTTLTAESIKAMDK